MFYHTHCYCKSGKGLLLGFCLCSVYLIDMTSLPTPADLVSVLLTAQF